MWFNRFFKTVMNLLNAHVSIEVPSFPVLWKDKTHDEVKNMIFSWISDVLKKQNEYKDRDEKVQFNSCIIQRLDKDFTIVREDSFDISSISD